MLDLLAVQSSTANATIITLAYTLLLALDLRTDLPGTFLLQELCAGLGAQFGGGRYGDAGHRR